ncbi:MAG: hypothetical protein ABJA87_04105 [bacterium]
MARLVAGSLLLLALVAWIDEYGVNGSGAHSWNAGRPPATVHLTAGRQYDVSSRDGLRLLTVRQETTEVDLTCTYTRADGPSSDLAVTPLTYDPRVLHRLGTFTATVTGRVAVSCIDAGAVWVDSADGASFDTAGFLVLLTIAFALAGGLLALRQVSSGRPPRRRPELGSER